MAEDVLELRKFVAPEFVFGPGAAMLAGQYAANLSIKKALVVTGPHLEALGCTGQVGRQCRLFRRHSQPA